MPALTCQTYTDRRVVLKNFLGSPAPKSAVPNLVKALTDRDADVRVLAAHVLGLLGAEAKSAETSAGAFVNRPEREKH